MNIEEYTDNLSTIRQIELREHIGKAYEVAESVDGVNPDENLDFHRQTISTDDDVDTESIVPIISADFNDHGKAQSMYTELRNICRDINIEVHDLDYNKQENTISVILEPFRV